MCRPSLRTTGGAGRTVGVRDPLGEETPGAGRVPRWM